MTIRIMRTVADSLIAATNAFEGADFRCRSG